MPQKVSPASQPPQHGPEGHPVNESDRQSVGHVGVSREGISHEGASRDGADTHPGQQASSTPEDTEQQEVDTVTRSGWWRRATRRARMFVVGATVALVAAVVAVVLYTVPVFALREITVEGNTNTPYAEVVDATGFEDGKNLLILDMKQAVHNLVALPWIYKAEIHTKLPNTVAIAVTEHEPLLYLTSPEGDILIDRKGNQFMIAPHPEGTVEVQGAAGDDLPRLTAAATVVGALAPEIRAQVASIDVSSPERITVRLADERTVFWGTSEQAEAKARVMATVLTQPGTQWNVSDPYLVTVKD